jgi:hypothetical protein
MAQPNRARRGGRDERTDATSSESVAGETSASAAGQQTASTSYQGGSASQSQQSPYQSQTGTNGDNGIAQKIREQVNARLSSQKDRALDGVGGVTEAIRRTSQTLRDNQHDTVAQYLEQALGQVDRFAETLRQKDIKELMVGAQRLARRRPGVFVGSAFALGLISARFFKSSRPDYGEDTGYSAGEYRTRGVSSSGSEQFSASRERPEFRGIGRE